MMQVHQNLSDDLRLIGTVQRRLLIFGGVLAFLSLIGKHPSAVYGFLLGCLTSFLQFRALEVSVKRQLKLPKEGAVRYARTSYFQRMLLASGAILVSLIRSEISFLTTVIGLLLIKPAIYSLYFEEWVISSLRRKNPEHGR